MTNTISNVAEYPFINGHMKIANVPYMSVELDIGKHTYLTSTIMKNIAAITRYMQKHGMHEYDYKDYQVWLVVRN